MKAEFKCWSSFHKDPPPIRAGRAARLPREGRRRFRRRLPGGPRRGGGRGLRHGEPVAELLGCLQLDVDSLVFAMSRRVSRGRSRRSGALTLRSRRRRAARSRARSRRRASTRRRPTRRSGSPNAQQGTSKLLAAFAKAESKAGGEGVAYAGLPARRRGRRGGPHRRRAGGADVAAGQHRVHRSRARSWPPTGSSATPTSTTRTRTPIPNDTPATRPGDARPGGRRRLRQPRRARARTGTRRALGRSGRTSSASRSRPVSA